MRLAILTTAVASADRDLLEARLAAPLAAVGIEAVLTEFSDELDLRGCQAATPLLAWGYHERIDLWSARLDDLERSGLPILNPVSALRWNSRKSYLAELASHGAAIVPTEFVHEITPEAVDAARARFDTPLVVVKPLISAGAMATVRLAPGDPLDGTPPGAAMIQPYLPAIVGEGEISLLYFGGRFSHAVLKVAAPGDFRVQARLGGAARALPSPSREAFAAADTVLAACPHRLDYARVDLIRGPDGGLVLMELEAIEPDLFLQFAPDGGAAFAAAFAESLGV